MESRVEGQREDTPRSVPAGPQGSSLCTRSPGSSAAGKSVSFSHWSFY